MAVEVTIAAPVGRGVSDTGRRAVNIPDDVQTVVGLLNAIENGSGGRKNNPIPPTNIVTDEVYNQVREFQKRQFNGWSDGVVDHDNRRTLRRLKELAQPTPVVIDPDQPEIIKPAADIIIFISGVQDEAGGGGADLTPASGQVEFDDLLTVAPRPGFKRILRGFGGSLVNDFGVVKAFRTIDDNFTAASKVIIYGYSAGAKQSLELCERLESRNGFRKQDDKPLIAVNLLVTVDAAARQQTDQIRRVVAGCVKFNANMFQTHKSLTGSCGGPNSPATSKVNGNVPTVNNKDMTGELANFSKSSMHEQIRFKAHPIAMRQIRLELA